MKKYIYINLLFVMATLVGCSDYLDINDNPNGATTPPLPGLLANVTYNSGINTYSVGATASYYTQYLASPNEGSDTDSQTRVNTDGAWTGIYRTASDIYDLKKFAQEKTSIHYEGVADILMAYNMALAVDVYGNVPYSEAFDFATNSPAYDDGKAVYDEIFNLLDEGIAALNQTNEGIPLDEKSDLIHHGDIQKWIKTGYALKARYLNHLSKVTGSYDPQAVLDAVGKSYTSNADDAQIQDYQKRGPWAQVALNNEQQILNGWLSEQIVDAMNGTTFGIFDPRLPLITNATNNGDYVGTVNGKGRSGSGTENEQSVLPTDGFFSHDDAPVFMVTYSELKFIEAEAHLRKDNNTAAAYDAYIEGITANMEKLQVDQTEIDDYIDAPEVAIGAGAMDLNAVFKEKYVAMFLNPEAWVDARRIDYDYVDFDLPVNHNPQLNGEFIRSFDYPDTERQRNGENVPVVDLSRRVFWDVD